jgi:hypothetical protein
VTIKDREWYEYELGTFYLCAEAFDAYSAYASVHDFKSEGIFNGDEKIEYHMHLHRDDAMQMRFTRDELLTSDVTVKFSLTHFTIGDDSTAGFEIFYKLCRFAECILDDEEKKGVGNVESAILQRETINYGSTSASEVAESYVYSGEINHAANDCELADHCIYIFSLYNPSAQSAPRDVKFLVEFEMADTQDIRADRSYKNIIEMGRYQYYRLLDSQFDLDYIRELKI